MGGFKIATIKGIPIRVHYSFLLILPFLAYQFGLLFRAAAQHADVPLDELHGNPFVWGLVLTLALFFSVLIHELAHSLYALRKGGRVRDITLLMIGGVSNLSEPPRSPRAEAVMALVGPLTSLALGVIFYAVDRVVAGFGSFELKFGFFYLAEMNVFLGLFNLLPAFPMDGGRVVRALLVPRYGLIRATQIAAGLGKSFAIVFGIIGLFSFNIVLMIIAFFIFLGAEGESRGVLVKTMLGHFRVRDLMSPVRGSVSPKNSVYEAAERMLRDKCLAYPVIDNGRLAGVVTVGLVERVSPANRDRTLVEEVMRPAHVVSPDDDVSRALQAISDKDVGLLPVVQDGTPVGILQRSDVIRGLKLQELEVSQKQTAAWHGDSDRAVHVGA